jgi:hypothetical protein
MNFILSYRNFHFLPNDFDLDYADDIVLLSHNFRDMQEMVDDLVLKNLRKRINIEKTKDLRVNSRTTEAFKIRQEMIGYSSNFFLDNN